MSVVLVDKSHEPEWDPYPHIKCSKCGVTTKVSLYESMLTLVEPCVKANEDIVSGAESLLKDSTFEPIKKETGMPVIYTLESVRPTSVTFVHVVDSAEYIQMSRDRWKALGRPETLITEFKGGDE